MKLTSQGEGLFKVAAVIVTHQPAPDKLRELLSAVASQVSFSVVVDNGSNFNVLQFVESAYPGIVSCIALKYNLGIALAQNIGISRAREMGADYVLLSDQDSVPHHSMVRVLLAALEKICTTEKSLACVGPRYLDDRQRNPPPFIRVIGLALKRCHCTAEDSIVPVDYLISSGCLIPMKVLEQVGGMREDLFIDYVDIEWGLRARHAGVQSYGVCSAHMEHNLGDSPIRLFGKHIPLHTPLRHYYHFRNAVLLYKESWIPLNWKLVDGWRLCLKYVFYSLFAKPRLAHWQMMSLGVWHGLVGKTGKI